MDVSLKSRKENKFIIFIFEDDGILHQDIGNKITNTLFMGTLHVFEIHTIFLDL